MSSPYFLLSPAKSPYLSVYGLTQDDNVGVNSNFVSNPARVSSCGCQSAARLTSLRDGYLGKDVPSGQTYLQMLQSSWESSLVQK